MEIVQVENGVDGSYRASAGIPDAAIKLFGSSIPLATFEASDPTSSVLLNACCQQDTQSAHSNEAEKQMEFSSNDLSSPSGSNDSNIEVGPASSLKAVSGIIQDAVRLPPPCQESINMRPESAQNHVVLEKTAKKPDKPIPCPRCESLDTKFCYFNNYNVNQPRHFCRKCQRYWTAGGTLRNVPVGAGRRKNKHSTSHQKHAACTDMSRVRCDAGDMVGQRCTSAHSIIGVTSSSGKQPVLQVPSLDSCGTSSLNSPIYSPATKGSMASVGQESPLCKSLAATTINMQKYTPGYNHEVIKSEAKTEAVVKLELEENLSLENNFQTSSIGSNVPVMSFQVPVSVNESVLSTCTHASDVASRQMDREANTEMDDLAKLSDSPNYNRLWQPGNMTTWKIPANGVDPEVGVVGLPPPGLLPNGAPPGSFWASPPWPLMYPPAMWGASPLAMPWGSAAAAAAAATAIMQNSGLGNTTMRKHQLEGSSANGCLWVPKTLRIDDPLDASRSSIWATLGLGDGPASSPQGVAANKAFRAKSESKDTGDSPTSFRHTNPAAFSRSVTFNESS